MTLASRVLQTIRHRALLAPGGRVVVALSGGGDSVALVHVLRELEGDGHVRIAALAHFNHQLRGGAADEDAAFCRTLADGLDVPFEEGTADVRAAARGLGRSVEDAARLLRYEFLDAVAERLGADAVAVGHSRDDQAETFLLRLLRGAGSQGLAAILPRAGRVIRPLLDVPRADLRAYAAERGLAFREDASNRDVSIPRNRVRHELIPYLEREFSPRISAGLARAASIAREEDDYLRLSAIDLARSIVLTPDGPAGDVDVDLDGAALLSLHPAMAARVARVALQGRAPGAFIGFEVVRRFLDFAADVRPGAALSLPGQQAVHKNGRVRLRAEPPRPRPGAAADGNVFAKGFSFPLPLPGEVSLEPQGWAISAERVEAPGSADKGVGIRSDRALAVEVAADPLRLPLTVRSRRPGDRFAPPGLGHRKKLHDYLIDRKVPRETRDSLPLVVDGADRIVWVVGEAIGADFRVTERSRGVILLQSRRLGGLG